MIRVGLPYVVDQLSTSSSAMSADPIGAAGHGQVMADVAGGLIRVETGDGVAQADALVEGGVM
jgi:hypothetical protein